MDVLSDAIAAMRTGKPHSSRTRWDGEWGVGFAPFSGAGCHVVLQGSCWVLPQGGDPVRLGVGDIALIPHGLAHGLADDPARCLQPTSDPKSLPLLSDSTDGDPTDTVLLCGAYLFDRARQHPLLAELPNVIHLRARLGAHAEVRAVVDLLGAELDRDLPGSAAIVPALLDSLLLYVLRAWHGERNANHPAPGWAMAMHDPAVGAALRAIHDDPAHPWTVRSLAAAGGLSRSPFAQRFTTLVGSPPLAYLTWWRMTTAARLLRESNRPVRRVAEDVGYTSEFAFAKAFKRAYGSTPGQYRHHDETELDGLADLG